MLTRFLWTTLKSAVELKNVVFGSIAMALPLVPTRLGLMVLLAGHGFAFRTLPLSRSMRRMLLGRQPGIRAGSLTLRPMHLLLCSLSVMWVVSRLWASVTLGSSGRMGCMLPDLSGGYSAAG